MLARALCLTLLLAAAPAALAQDAPGSTAGPAMNISKMVDW